MAFRRKYGGLTYQLIQMAGAPQESDTPAAVRAPIVMPTPVSRRDIGYAFALPNLLATTLAVAALSVPPGQQSFASAPTIRSQNSIDQIGSPLPIRAGAQSVPLPLGAADLSFTVSAPAMKAEVRAEQYPNTLARGIPDAGFLPALAEELSASAPAIKGEVRADQFINNVLLGIPQTSPRLVIVTPTPQATRGPQVDRQINLLTTTLSTVASPFLPIGAADLSNTLAAPSIRAEVRADQYVNTLALGILTPQARLPLVVEAPQAKFAVQVDRYPNLNATTLAPAIIPLLPLGAQTVDASAPIQKTQTTSCDQYVNNLLLGLTTFLPAWNDGGDPAPALRSQVYVDQVLNKVILLPTGPSLLPQAAATWDVSAPQVKQPPLNDQYVNNLLLGIPAPPPVIPLPLSSATWDTSAPITKYAVTVDVFPNLVVLTTPVIPLVPNLSEQLFASAPPPKYNVTIDAPQNLLGTTLAPPIIPLLPVDAGDWFASAPAVKPPVQVDVYPNLLASTLSPGNIPLLPIGSGKLDRSAPITKYQVIAENRGIPFTLGINGPPAIQEWTYGALITKYQVIADQFINNTLLGIPVTPTCVIIPAVQKYPFDFPDVFTVDFGVHANAGGYCAQVILSEPGQDILGGVIASNQYEIEYVTNELPLGYGVPVIIGTQTFKVLQTYMLDDGVFSRAKLET
jgi:hypothetical protein